jgi:hypothetical protein
VRILFVQPFGIGGPGGGPRILRSLIQAVPLDAMSVCTSPDPPPPTDIVEERHTRSRPGLGRLEHTRLAPSLTALDVAFQRRLARNLRRTAVEWGAQAVHSVAHSVDFWQAFRVSQELRLPYLLCVHDDLRYALRGSPVRRLALRRLGEAWRAADARFVITDQLGTEYCERYGDRSFSVVTDGLQSIAERPPEPSDSALHVYFMGAYHTAYRENFDALLAALARLRGEQPEREVTLTWRGGGLPFEHESEVPTEVRGFGPEGAPEREAGSADLLYLPLPFGRAHRDFVRFSLSTKLVTYLGTGRPILYHGPKEAAAARLLIEHDAAIVVDSPHPEDLVAALDRRLPQTRAIGANALTLARKEFSLSHVRDRFLSGLDGLAAHSEGRGR